MKSPGGFMLFGQIICMTISVGLWGTGEASQSQTPPESVIIVCYVGLPDTLEEAVSRSHVIVRARVTGSEYRKHVDPTDSSIANAYTAYALQVLETIKAEPKGPMPVEVLRFGGEIVTDRGIQKSVERGFPKFEVGAEYLLFLFWNEHLGTFHVMFGPDGAFRVSRGNRLNALGNSGFALRYDGREPQEVSSRVRDIVAAKQEQ